MKKVFLILIAIAALFTVVRPSVAADLERGKELYSRYCWWCHGESGEGNGPAADFLNPPPRDFTYGLYKWKSTPFDEFSPGDKDFMKMLGGDDSQARGRWSGLKGTAMPSWKGILNEGERKDVIAYIKGLAELEAPLRPPVDLSGRIKLSGESMERGRKLFGDNCAECHGRRGHGDGEKRLKDDFGVRTWPRDLTKPWTFRAGSTPADIYTRITVGIAGTQMPSFDDPQSKKRLSSGERWDIANYVSTLGEPSRRPEPGVVLTAFRVEGPLPEVPDDPAWDKTGYRSFYLAPQIIAPEREFTPTIDSISVKTLYNGSEVAILLEWDDPTESIPGDRASIKMAGGEVFRDGVAVEFPVKRPDGAKRPYFGMGDARDPVRIWFWQGPTVTSPERFSLIRARGYKVMKRRVAGAGVFASGVYDSGRWKVVMKGPLGIDYPGIGASSREAVFIPLAFAAWDGSNNERGSRHVMSGWHWLVLNPEKGAWTLLWPLVVFAVVFMGEVFIVRSVRRR